MATKKIGSTQLAMRSVRNGSVDDLEMGVLDDHSVYLTARGLANACGVAPSTIISWTKDWRRGSASARDRALEAILDQLGWDGDNLTKDVLTSSGKNTAHDELVCMAVLEYYEHDASVGEQTRATARHHRRAFSRAGMRLFVYQRLGISLQDIVRDGLAHFTDRLLKNPAPRGHFFVQTASAELVLDSARAGLEVGPHTVPDISIGKAWSSYWEERGLEAAHGPRRQHEYRYPSGTPQDGVSIEAWIYPNSARGEFETWLHEEYLTGRYPKYLATKLSQSARELLLQAVRRPALPDSRGAQR